MERWSRIPGMVNNYEASSMGRVRNSDTGRVLKQQPYGRRREYLSVNLRPIGRPTRPIYVHRLVLLAFHGEPTMANAQVRHLNGVPTDNRLENLRWGTQVENNLDIIRHGRHRNSAKTECPAGHPYDESNTYFRVRDGYVHRQCKACNRLGMRKRSQRQAA